MTTRLFGTDGIRGVANRWPLTPEFITRIGASIGHALRQGEQAPLALIGRDTRLSGEMIENALGAGLLSQGLNTLHVGVLTTPGIAFLTRALGARCGISISASHNPFEDNGIKVIGGDGFKIPDRVESEIETLAQSSSDIQPDLDPTALGRRRDGSQPVAQYLDFLRNAVNRQPILRGQRIVVDCNNGATFDLAPRLLAEFGAEVISLNVQPDGVNINRGYDALEPKRLRETVLQSQANWGVQFDGDGDRAVFVDERGNYADGDFILTLFARDWVERGLFAPPTVISTVMANMGLEKVLADMHVALERTQVGDRWVTERMRAIGARLGGEQSGHILLLDQGHTTGDGFYTALRVAEVMARRHEPLSALVRGMIKYPQILVNVRVPRKPPLDQIPEVEEQLARSREVLGGGARILLRYSGTENLARVMIEGSDSASIEREAHAIAGVIQRTIV